MAEVRGVREVIRVMRRIGARTESAAATVGYTASYAVYVHENLTAHHPVGQAKFLEQPARELSSELGSIVRQAVTKGKTLAQGLLLAGLRLQRASQLLCPIDTGFLKGSAFTRVTEG